MASSYLDALATSTWRAAFEQVPRAQFIPDTIWRRAGGQAIPLSRADDPATWQDAVDADAYVITQVDDGRPPHADGAGYRNSSSSSMPTVMAIMLEALDVSPGQRVLEIGTGTGWNAALLSYRLGADNVTSVEVDPVLADQAREVLTRAGHPVTVITGDGALGYQPGAPYDRVLATAGVAIGHVPYAWVEQTTPGGRIVTPWGTRWMRAGLVSLTVSDDGTASGPFVDHAVFMPLRHLRVDGEIPVRDQADAGDGTTTLHPWHVTGDVDGCAFSVALRLPDVEHSVALAHDHAVDAQHFETLLWHTESGSWASHQVTPDAVESEAYRVRQWGPRRLWDEAEDAYEWWNTQGCPGFRDFGVAVSRAEQSVWLHDIGNVVTKDAVPVDR